MAFQSTLPAQIGAGIPGEIAFDGPSRGGSATLRSADAANNRVGRALTLVAGGAATGSWQTGSAGAANPHGIIAQAGGAGVFVGILASPKNYATAGTLAGGALASTMVLPNEVQGEYVSSGEVFVELPAAAAVGDVVYYLTADGSLVTAAPGAAKPANTGAYAIGSVSRFALTGAGIACVAIVTRVGAPAGA